MPKSFASSLPTLSALLLALTVLAAGCGGATSVDYSPAAVQAAFVAAGVPVYGANGPGRDIISRLRRAPPRATSSGRFHQSARTHQRPLTAIAKGLRDALLVPTAEHQSRTTVLNGYFLSVSVYPSAKDAKRNARSLADDLAADEILHAVAFGYFQKGNVVVSYRVFNSHSRVPGFLGRFNSVGTIDRDDKQHIEAALRSLNSAG